MNGLKDFAVFFSKIFRALEKGKFVRTIRNMSQKASRLRLLSILFKIYINKVLKKLQAER